MVLPQPGGPWMRTPRGGMTPTLVNTFGCRIGSSTSSRILVSCLSTPPMSSYPPSSSSASSSARSSGSSRTSSSVEGATTHRRSGSVATTSTSTTCAPCRTRIRSPSCTGRYGAASSPSGAKCGARTWSWSSSAERPAIASESGCSVTFAPSPTESHPYSLTRSPTLTCRLERACAATQTASAGTEASSRTRQMVSRDRLPLRRTVSPAIRLSAAILSG
mmetsp:Transcript_40420/g.130359  ORF Transcript_40420/g.130359 Transcript_40420/m.130359 type:complete len:219 (+) Transcript_40420:2218-2874(+)